MLGVLRVVTARKAQEQRLEHLANYDELTGHFNKKRLREALDHMLAHSMRTGLAGAYLAIGIDKLAGDQRRVRLRGCGPGHRRDRSAARPLPARQRRHRPHGRRPVRHRSRPLSRASHRFVAEKILGRVSQMPIDTCAGPVYATVSIGAATFPDQAKTSYEVMTRAETALAEAKRAGRDCYIPTASPTSSANAIASAWRWASACSGRCAKAACPSPISPWSTVRRARSTITNACCA